MQFSDHRAEDCICKTLLGDCIKLLISGAIIMGWVALVFKSIWITQNIICIKCTWLIVFATVSPLDTCRNNPPRRLLLTFTWAGWKWELENFSSNIKWLFLSLRLSSKKSYKHIIKRYSLSISNCFSVTFLTEDAEVWIINQEKLVYHGVLHFYILILEDI